MSNFYLTDKRLHSIYYNMRDRCNNPKNKKFHRYGARGIKVCEEWLNDISLFIKWAKANGYHGHLQIDRINNDGGYYPKNCRWVTQKVNSRNTSRNRKIELNGKEKIMIEWSDDLGINYNKISDRLKRGWPASEALNPVGQPLPKPAIIPKRQREYMKRDLSLLLNQHFNFFQIFKG